MHVAERPGRLRRVLGRHPERQQHRLAVGRPEPDLHLARLASGVPARVRDERGHHPVSTGKLLGGLPAGQTYLESPDGQDGIGTWAAVKKQAAEKLGLLLVDKDVTNIPMIAADPYGKFIPGPLRGLPQYVTAPAWSRAISPAPCRCRRTCAISTRRS